MYTITRIKRKYAQYIGVMPNKKSYKKEGKPGPILHTLRIFFL